MTSELHIKGNCNDENRQRRSGDFEQIKKQKTLKDKDKNVMKENVTKQIMAKVLFQVISPDNIFVIQACFNSKKDSSQQNKLPSNINEL